MNAIQAAENGAGSLLIGIAPVGGQVAPSWIPSLFAAIEAGLDVVSGLHSSLADVPGLAEAAKAHGVRLVDVRRPPAHLPTATGRKRNGKRLLRSEEPTSELQSLIRISYAVLCLKTKNPT